MYSTKEESEKRDEDVCYFCGRGISKKDLDEGRCSWCGMTIERKDERIG